MSESVCPENPPYLVAVAWVNGGTRAIARLISLCPWLAAACKSCLIPDEVAAIAAGLVAITHVLANAYVI